jgi:hypothetical protein
MTAIIKMRSASPNTFFPSNNPSPQFSTSITFFSNMHSILLFLFSACFVASAHAYPETLHNLTGLSNGSLAFQSAVTLENEDSPIDLQSGIGEVSITKIQNKYRKHMKDILTSRGSDAACNADNVVIRRSW